MSHSDYRSAQVGASSHGDVGGMDAAISPTTIASNSLDSSTTNTTTEMPATTRPAMAPGQHPNTQSPVEQHTIPAANNADAVLAKGADPMLVDDQQIEMASHALKAMAHPLRLKILCILAASQEVSVQGLVERVGTTQSNISQHLSVLREKHVLDCRKDANKVFYRIRDERFLNVIRSVHDALH